MVRFDIVGNKEKAVAIMDTADKNSRKNIAKEIMRKHKNVKTVLMKASPRKGVYRLRTLKLILGSKNTKVTHTESGCRFMLDPRKVYFSSREGTERLRIVEKIKTGDLVAVFFAGAGPFPVVIAKKSKAREIVGIEKNPAAVRYFRQNVELNKLRNVIAIKDDVKNLQKKFPKSFDRIIMPLPEKAVDYMDVAIDCLRPDGIIHLYFFSDESEINELKKKLKSMTEKELKFLHLQRVLPYGPGLYKYRLDIKVS